MTEPLAFALERLLERVHDLEHDWLLAGSTSAILQGAAVPPNDLDIPQRDPEGIRAFAERLAEFAPQGPAVPDGVRPPQDWWSTRDQPVITFPSRGGLWTYARWQVGGVEIETAHIVQPGEENLVAEIHGEPIWGLRRFLGWRGYRLPVSPLEVNLVLNLLRGRHEKASAAASVLRRDGCDRALLERTARDRGVPWEAVEAVVAGAGTARTTS